MVAMERIHHYFPQLTDLQLEKLAQLKEIYAYWNARINLVSRKDFDFFYERHVLHSLGIAQVCWLENGVEVLDVGTGGGFPGIPLAIVFPSAHFHLVDSTGKKIKVVQEVARELELSQVRAEQQRAEEVGGRYDFIVSRAVTHMPRFLAWTRRKLKIRSLPATLPNGILYLKGGDLREELQGIPHQLFPLREYFSEEFFDTKHVVYIPAAKL